MFCDFSVLYLGDSSMPYKKKSRQKKNNTFKKNVAIAMFALAIVLSPLLIYSFIIINPSKSALSESALNTTNVAEGSGVMSNLSTPEQDIEEMTQIEDASSELAGKWLGLCEKNSVNSVEDFQQAILRDEVLLSHYSDFDWQNARLGKQNEAVWAFVSHRKGDVIKKTAKPIRLPKGDGYITDGTHIARTYCCNDIILSPSAGLPPEKDIVMDPSAGMPPTEEVTLAPLPVEIPAEIIPAIIPAYGKSFPPTRSYRRVDPPINSSPEPVPEPGTMVLFGTGLVLLAVASWRKKFASKPANQQTAQRVDGGSDSNP